MMPKSSILIILISFVLGISVSYLTGLHWVLIFSLWATSLIGLVIIILFAKKKIRFKTGINILIILVFFLSGMLGFSLKQPSSYANYVVNEYLKGDYLIGEIIDYQIGKSNYDRAIVKLNNIVKYGQQKNIQGKILCYIKTYKKHLEIGDRILFQPDIHPIKNKNNPGEFNAERYWMTKGVNLIAFVPINTIQLLGNQQTIKGFWTASRRYLEQIITHHVSQENQGLAIALTLGDKSYLSNEETSNFAHSGAMHVLAVSGMHIGILLVFIQWIFKQFKWFRKRNLYLYFALIFLWAFALLTGMSASVVRAVAMFSLLAIGQLLGKRYFGLQGIFGSALILLIFNPLYLFDIGFQLSYLAVLGIGLFYRRILSLFHSKYRIINWIWEGTAIGIAAQIGTVPLSLYYFHQFPNYTLLTNLGAMIFSGVALISVVLLLIFFAVPGINQALSYLVDFIYHYFSEFIDWINTLPAVTSNGFSPNVFQILLIYFGILICLYYWVKAQKTKFKWSIIGLFLVLLSIIIGREINKNKQELIVLNHYQKVILVKNKRNLYIIYNAENHPSQEDLNYLVKGYETTVGTNGIILGVSNNNKIILSPNVYISNKNDGMYIKYFDHHLLLADEASTTVNHQNYNIVKGNWNPYLTDKGIAYNTLDQALILNPNEK